MLNLQAPANEASDAGKKMLRILLNGLLLLLCFRVSCVALFIYGGLKKDGQYAIFFNCSKKIGVL